MSSGIRIDRLYRELPAVDCNGLLEGLERERRHDVRSALLGALAELDAWAESAEDNEGDSRPLSRVLMAEF